MCIRDSYTVDSMKYRAYLEFMFYSKPLRKVIASTVSRSKNAFSKLKTKKGKNAKLTEFLV